MAIIVYAEQFKNGAWDVWEHTCSAKEAKALVDSAVSRAIVRSQLAKPTHDDFMASARHLFDMVRGSVENPHDGDVHVYCICIEKLVIGVYEKIRQYANAIEESHQFIEVGLRKSA